MVLRFLLALGMIFIRSSRGWSPASEYVYSYNGRIASGIREMKDQYAFTEIIGHVIVQSINDTTLIVKFVNGSVDTSSSYDKDPYAINEEELSSRADRFTEMEEFRHLERPFVIHHRFGSFRQLQFSPEDPTWAVNMKKAIATHLQLDATGIRSIPEESAADSGNLYVVHESGVTGDCRTTIQVNELATWQSVSYSNDYGAICGASSGFYEITKSKDYDRCTDNPLLKSANPPFYDCNSLGGSGCRRSIQRMSTTKFIACGQWPSRIHLVRIDHWGHLLSTPFGIDVKQITNAVVTNFKLKRRQTLISVMDVPQSMEETNSLSYQFPELSARNSEPPGVASGKVMAALRTVANQLISSTEVAEDMVERLVGVRYALAAFSLQELRHLWSKIKSQHPVVRDLFVDCLVTTGSNATVSILLELIGNETITGTQAEWSLMSLGHYIKTPTFQLLQHLTKWLTSNAVQSSKPLRQAAHTTMADLLNSACTPLAARKYSTYGTAPLCTNEQFATIKQEFLPLLTRELDQSDGVDRMAALSAIGLLNCEDVVPILMPYIRGHDPSDTAFRIRAILSLHRAFHNIPLRIYPILLALAFNIAERPEVRMVAISILLNIQVPVNVWQKVASRTWFEPNQQVRGFTYNMIRSYTKLKISTPSITKLVAIAKSVLHLAKPSPVGYTWSTLDVQSWILNQDLGVTTHTMFFRVSDEYPVVIGHGWHYQMGPFTSDRMQAFVWNYNMEEAWNRFISFMAGTSAGPPSITGYLEDIWNQIKPARRPPDQRVGAVHLTLMGFFNRFYNVEHLMDSIYNINWLKDHTIPLQWSKFRQLAEIEVHLPNDLGLSTRYLAQLPFLASTQGQMRWRSKAIESDAVTMVTWKLIGEIRTRLPFSGRELLSGVDVRVAINLPRNIQLQFNGRLDSKFNLGNEINDLFYYHVKPYTAVRHETTWHVPTLEDSSARIIEIGRPIESNFNIPLRGINLSLSVYSEYPHNDAIEWSSWFHQWTMDSYWKLAFVPLTLHQRQYRLRYSPEGTTVRSISNWFQYWNLQKSQVPDSFESIFQRLGGSQSHLLDTGFAVQRINGSKEEYAAILGLARDQFKNQMDLRILNRSTSSKFDSENLILCATNKGKWNSVNVDEGLVHSERIEIHFGNNCSGNSRILLHVNMASGQSAEPRYKECETGFEEIPVCKVQADDRHFTEYEVELDFSETSEELSKFLDLTRLLTNRYLNQFVTSYRLEANDDFKLTFRAIYDPIKGSTDLRMLWPNESISARNVRLLHKNTLSALVSNIYPLRTRSLIQTATSFLTAGVSDSKCFVNSERVITYDGVFYKYTLNECNHVLVTDCYLTNQFAVLARIVEGRMLVQVVLNDDIITVDSLGNADVNGIAKSLEPLEQFEVGKSRLLVVVRPREKDVKIKLLEIGLHVTVNEAEVQTSGPSKIRGRSCGLCGDFNQEINAEFKTASRCVVSSSKLMAASFQVHTDGSQCARSSQLKMEIDTCKSADDIFRTDLRSDPDI